MHRAVALTIFLSMFLLTAGTNAATKPGGGGGGRPDPATQPRFVADELSVKFAGEASVAGETLFATANGLQELYRNDSIGWVDYRIIDGASPTDKVDQLRINPLVSHAVPNLLGEWETFPNNPPNDPNWSDQWGLDAVGMLQAWQITGGGTCCSHPMAIVDSGVDVDNPDLEPVGGKSFVPNSPSKDDVCTAVGGHGTLVAGLAAAYANNGIGIAGVAYNAPIWSLRVSSDCTAGPSATYAANAITYAVDHGAYAITASWTFHTNNLPDQELGNLHDAVVYAYDHNVPVVAASGNDGHAFFSDLVPAKWLKVITVGGTDQSNHRCTWQVYNDFGQYIWQGANYGDPGLDVSAPCLSIIATKAGGGTVTEGGTSLAVPVVAGVVFLIKSRHPNWTSDQIKSRLANTAAKVGGYDYGWSSYCGGSSSQLGCGLLDAAAAVQ